MDAVDQPNATTYQPQPEPRRDRSSRPRRRPHRLAWIALAIGILVMGIAAWMVVEARIVTVAEYEIASPDVPPDFDGTTVVFLTDIHHGPFFSRERVRSPSSGSPGWSRT